ncbi:hypothetical protein [Geomesophilobacter sediminis]|uniref:Uncharacterized protein n=1 Tax=Geomesophilobacter sediminis TaxID=2798584 RepID=A0A8J7M0F7_9BACT|nr:hypothetical protein [Geomesophilobacter sediminis]MBJ6724947.1 hypothetical protein [Geomesophilobacter sediminis]
MKSIRSIVAIALFLGCASPCFAEDKVSPVFDQLDDLMTRVESGISLNSYAEALAQLKIDYKKALENPDTVDNPLRSDRMKVVLNHMDGYAKVWRIREIDGYGAILRYPDWAKQANQCVVNVNGRVVYEISCLKAKMLDVLKEEVANAKSAHVNGW